MKSAAAAVGALVLGTLSLAVQAQNYAFNCITNNSAVDCGIAEAQLSLSVIDQGSSVDFRFTNAGLLGSSITDVYFDWTTSAYALIPGEITDSGMGVSFSWGAAPPDLPGGTDIAFDADLGADSGSPTQPNGVNPGEWLNLNFTGSYASFLEGLSTSQLRVGIHVQGFDGGGSESLVVTAIPEPDSYAMLLAGLGLVGWAGWRRRRLSA